MHEHYIQFKSGTNIFLCFDNYFIKESTSLFEHNQFYFELKGNIVSLIDVDLVESVYHYNEIIDIVNDNKTYDYQYKPLIDNDVLPFPDVEECRFKVFSDAFDLEFHYYNAALAFARRNACAVFDCESCRIIDDFRGET